MDRGLIRVPYLHDPSVGLGLLAGAVLVAAPAIAALVGTDPLLGLRSSDDVAGLPAWIPLLVGAAILLILAVLDLADRRELRQGGAALAFGGLLVLGLVLALLVRDALQGAVSERDRLLLQVPALLLPIWGCALALGSVGFGPTRSAVVIGLVTLAIALLLPSAPNGKPFIAWLFTNGPIGPAWVLAMFLIGAWRLLDLPWLGGLLIGAALLVATIVLWSGGAIAIPTEAVAKGMLPIADLLALLDAAAVSIAVGALLGRPPTGFVGG